jgi:hypothetical protein
LIEDLQINHEPFPKLSNSPPAAVTIGLSGRSGVQRMLPPHFHPTSPLVTGIFNHELLTIVGKKDNSSAYIGSSSIS